MSYVLVKGADVIIEKGFPSERFPACITHKSFDFQVNGVDMLSEIAILDKRCHACIAYVLEFTRLVL